MHRVMWELTLEDKQKFSRRRKSISDRGKIRLTNCTKQRGLQRSVSSTEGEHGSRDRRRWKKTGGASLEGLHTHRRHLVVAQGAPNSPGRFQFCASWSDLCFMRNKLEGKTEGKGGQAGDSRLVRLGNAERLDKEAQDDGKERTDLRGFSEAESTGPVTGWVGVWGGAPWLGDSWLSGDNHVFPPQTYCFQAAMPSANLQPTANLISKAESRVNRNNFQLIRYQILNS